MVGPLLPGPYGRIDPIFLRISPGYHVDDFDAVFVDILDIIYRILVLVNMQFVSFGYLFPLGLQFKPFLSLNQICPNWNIHHLRREDIIHPCLNPQRCCGKTGRLQKST
jgi:hypothetical protein